MSRVVVDFEGKKTGFDQTAKGVGDSLKGLKNLAAGAFSVGAITAFSNRTLEFADRIDKAAKRMKLTTDQVQALDVIGNDVGTSLESIEAAFLKIEKARQKALEGDANALNYFKALGVTIEALTTNYDKVKLTSQLAKASNQGSTSVQGVALQGLGLKSLGAELGLLGDTLDNLGDQVQRLRDVGAIADEKDIESLVAAKDKFELLERTIMVQLVPAVEYLTDKLQKVPGLMEDVANLINPTEVNAGDEVRQQNRINRRRLQLQAQGKSSKEIADELRKFGLNTSGEDTLAPDALPKTAPLNLPDKLDRPDRPAKGAKLFSDTLTETGNFLGQSFKNSTSLSSQMEFLKEQSRKQSELVKEAKTQSNLLTNIEKNTAKQTSNDDWEE